jgi:hypothetical protein
MYIKYQFRFANLQFKNYQQNSCLPAATYWGKAAFTWGGAFTTKQFARAAVFPNPLKIPSPTKQVINQYLVLKM